MPQTPQDPQTLQEGPQEESFTADEWLRRAQAGAFSTRKTVEDAGWWDWFCAHEDLVRRTREHVVPVVALLREGTLVDPTQVTVSLKNSDRSQNRYDYALPEREQTTYDVVQFLDAKTESLVAAVAVYANRYGYEVSFPGEEHHEGLTLEGLGALLTRPPRAEIREWSPAAWTAAYQVAKLLDPSYDADLLKEVPLSALLLEARSLVEYLEILQENAEDAAAGARLQADA